MPSPRPICRGLSPQRGSTRRTVAVAGPRLRIKYAITLKALASSHLLSCAAKYEGFKNKLAKVVVPKGTPKPPATKSGQ